MGRTYFIISSKLYVVFAIGLLIPAHLRLIICLFTSGLPRQY